MIWRKISLFLIVIVCVLSLVTFLVPSSTSVPALLHGDIPAFLANKDFANYWIAARLALSGEVLDVFSDHEIYFVHMQAAFGEDYPWHAWSYPPHYLLFVWPLGFLSYVGAMGLFLGLTLVLFLWAANKFIGKLDGAALIVMLPFVIFNFWAAQNGFLTGALMLGALAWRSERPVLAGLLAGCLTIKPQLGLLLPILFLIEGRWAVIASATATTAALVAISAAAFGPQSWVAYVDTTFVYQREVMSHGTGVFLAMMPSLFGSLRRLGVDGGLALAVHGLFAIPALVAAIVGFLWSKNENERASILIVATFAITPYSLAYDLGVVSAAVAVAASSRQASSFAIVTLMAAALLPLIIVPLGFLFMPIAPFVILATLGLLLQRSSTDGINRKLSLPVSASD